MAWNFVEGSMEKHGNGMEFRCYSGVRTLLKAGHHWHHISTHEHNHDNVYDEITSESMYKIYLGHVSFFFKTTTNLPRSL